MVKLILVALMVVVNLAEILGHGRVMDPVNRSSAWRRGFDVEPNYEDDENYCGGFGVQFEQNGGKCGVCGDPHSERQPRDNENGGRFGTGRIVKTYTAGQRFTAEIELTANHWGDFEFAVCPLAGADDVETDECFAKYPVKLANGQDRYQLTTGRTGTFRIDLVLPAGVTCEHCSFRWSWRVANSWGVCDDGTEAIGCGDQETFRSCSDIAIV